MLWALDGTADRYYLHSYACIFAYLSVMLDAFTELELSYLFSGALVVSFIKETVEILIRDYGVSLHQETIIHSDQGSYLNTPKPQVIEKKPEELGK